jgi:D-sedoheptulose 7-phosphate isomerase
MDYLQQLIQRYPQLEAARDSIDRAYKLLKAVYENKGKLLVAGNGGSAADAEHIVGELMKGFVKKRPVPADFEVALQKLDAEHGAYLAGHLQQGLPAIALPVHIALTTACLNDIGADIIYAQQVYGYGNPGDAFLGISTSGNAKNIYYAMVVAKAKAKGLKTIALTGGSGGAISKIADLSIIVPETETYKIQELHLPIYHALCLMLEEHFFP